jgi:hypothetical protein
VEILQSYNPGGMEDGANMPMAQRVALGPEDRVILAVESDTVARHTCKAMQTMAARVQPEAQSLLDRLRYR